MASSVLISNSTFRRRMMSWDLIISEYGTLGTCILNFMDSAIIIP
uniref:Uncharacterized protein n=1 Tax=Setaria italica TaxID=4555 RepID=K3YNU8_SETIT